MQRMAAQTKMLIEKVRHGQAQLNRKEFNQLVAKAARTMSSSDTMETIELMKKHYEPDEFTFNTMLHALAKENKHEQVMQLLETMIDGKVVGRISYQIALRSCGWNGRLQEAQQIMKKMQNDKLDCTVEGYNGLIDACIDTGNIETAYMYYNNMLADDIVPNANVLYSMIKVHKYTTLDSTTTDALMKIFFETKSHNTQPGRELVCLLLQILSNNGNTNDIMKIMKYIKKNCNVGRDIQVYNTAIEIMSTNGCAEEGFRIYDLMKSNKLRPNAQTRDLLGQLQSKEDMNQKKLLHLIRNLKRSTKHINQKNMNILIREATRKLPMEHAMDLFQIMKSNANSSLRPDIITYNTLLTGLKNSKQHIELMHLLNEMIVKNMADNDSFHIALASCSISGCTDDVDHIVQAMRVLKYSISERGYNMAINACASEGNVEYAEELFNSMTKCNITPSEYTYGCMMKVYSRNKRDTAMASNKAKELLEKMIQNRISPDPSCMFSFVSALSNGPDCDEVLSYVRQFPTLPVNVDIGVYNCAIDSYRKRGMWREALQVYEASITNGVKPSINTYTQILLACANDSEYDIAMKFLNHIQQEKNVPPSVDIFNAVIEVCTHTSRYTEALQLLNGLKSCGLSPNRMTYSRVLNALGQSGEVYEAINLLEQMKSDSLNPSISDYNRVLGACAKAGDVNKAEMILSEVHGDSSVQPDVVTYNSVLTAMLRCEDKESASLDAMLDILDEMKLDALTKPDVVTYSILMKRCFTKNNCDIDTLSNLFEDMIGCEIGPDELCIKLYLDSCRSIHLRDADDKTRARDCLKKVAVILSDKDFRFNSLILCNSALELLAVHDMCNEAIDLLRQIESHGRYTSVESYNIVMALFNRHGQHENVLKIFHTMQNALRIKPDSVSYIECLIALEGLEKWIEVTDCFLEMNEKCEYVSPDLLDRTAIGRYSIRSNKSS